jgi:hypothetical protein
VIRILVLLALLAAGCSGGARTDADCIDHGDCNRGVDLLEACIDFHCTAAGCLSSNDCPRNRWCDTAQGAYTCRAGCQGDDDCPAGQACEGGACVQAPCRMSNLDCEFGEVCDPQTGACSPTTDPFCAECDPESNTRTATGTPDDVCDDRITGSGECGGVGHVCAPSATLGNCWLGCTTQLDCPAGYTCEGVPQATPDGCEVEVLWLGPLCRPHGVCPG